MKNKYVSSRVIVLKTLHPVSLSYSRNVIIFKSEYLFLNITTEELYYVLYEPTFAKLQIIQEYEIENI